MFSPDYRAANYWTESTPLPVDPGGSLPSEVDVLVVGAGYTGLCVAHETARAGRSTLVLDAGPIGGGCSSRNGGQVAFSIKPPLAELAARHGRPVAERIHAEGEESLAMLRSLVADERLDCDWRDVGGFVGAHTRRQFDALRREHAALPEPARRRVTVVERQDLPGEIDSPLYHGGLVYHDDAAIHPARYLVALHARAVAAGARVHGDRPVLGIDRTTGGYDVRAGGARVHARDVVLATNGYTGPLSPWHRRRIVPIGSYIVATEALDRALVRRLIPHARNVGDTRHVIVYVRPSPDGTRILFGGRASAGEQDVTRCVPRLHAMLAEMFPALARTRISHAWMGFVAFTFDTLPHVGSRDRLHWAMGYCGQGIPLATYYGTKLGRRVAGRPGGETALEGLPFPTRPGYTGRPWFLPAAVAFYRFRDALGW
jgi:glycine/D-amino acid oxidase-like deaminating enzyme